MRGGYRHHALAKGLRPVRSPARRYPLQPRPTQRKKNSMPFSALLHRRDSDMSSNFADILDFVY